MRLVLLWSGVRSRKSIALLIRGDPMARAPLSTETTRRSSAAA
ncbi:hypothetical protein STAFG_4382 [Streptomyces afghaniensis 772]|uniref:Uncharacterized protein n=1 Tax=Streptomyces afghaniensis 772 TaxID=1283301 RepID=S4MP83_9ACTN|nr:hypothetical protein STAFG_4382 [Streptomyces afghaniensis 772]